MSARVATCVCLLGLTAVGVGWADEPELKLTKEEQLIVDLTNKARAEKDLPPLKPNVRLFKVARAHAANMAKHQEMNHVLDGKNTFDRLRAAGYKFAWAGENVAVTFHGLRPRAMFKGWMNSKVHHANIMRPGYTEIGIGIARSKKGDYYYAQEFGSRKAR
ncbi:MAG TPA: CAP domain-containing protein [Gemmataceae bacterium]|nr:CAP domain-containing protein [Gemmataceae bacterium]